jgi:Cu+-exporting ATPase
MTPTDLPAGAAVAPTPPTAADPVCGTPVNTDAPPGGTHAHGGVTYQFCGEACRRRFRRLPEKYLSPDVLLTGVPEPPAVVYVCPNCPQVEADAHGPCPACGQPLEVAAGTLDDRPDPELADYTRRMWVGVILTVPLLASSVVDMVLPDRPLANLIGDRALLVAQALLALPVVVWCGRPLLGRAWESIRRRRADMFTLVGIGVWAATAYSLAAVVYDLFGLSPRADVPQANDEPSREGVWAAVSLLSTAKGLVEPFFESAAGIVVLVLVGQVMELRARWRTGEAVRNLLTLAPTDA